ncbi:alpha/beta hydrolase [Phycicoccus sp. CSK15P-2]|uniref:alpha/beta fold hydrolase n=1 Tax=Phycicoccus sp. CSK15P-2 TaxID=2807627 RepID=UPI00194E645A|nr:alpha/beta hydrolase [Phycicoccus sp. CSK15P-2]MBM6405589.1 alpha/beta hydrolase [Phycicoccus sp. CSK15P-2]
MSESAHHLTPSDQDLAASLGAFTSRLAVHRHVRLRYVIGGEGPLLVLLPSWPETWWTFRKVMPALAAARRTVLAVDLPGMGASDPLRGGYDRKAMAARIRDLVVGLGYRKADVAGHGIGAQVAFSLAANSGDLVDRVVLMESAHPDEELYTLPLVPRREVDLHPWWVALHWVPDLAETVLRGPMRPFVDLVLDAELVDPTNVADLDREVYAAALQSPGAVSAAAGWFRSLATDIRDLEGYDQIPHPTLGLASWAGDGTVSRRLKSALARQTRDGSVVTIPDSGHFFPEERPRLVVAEMLNFLE